MLAGSKITGHTTSHLGGSVYISGGGFTMQGGEITGNHTSSASADAAGGMYLGSMCSFTMSGGSITGNTRGASNEAMDVSLDSMSSATKTGGTIGVSIPADF